MTFATADLYDDYEEELRIVKPILNHYGGVKNFSGIISTVKVFEDNSLVRAALEEPVEGSVLVVDGGGSLHCALLGDMLAELGIKNGWAGIIINGCVRDSAVIADMKIGVMALNTNPRKSVKRGQGERDVSLDMLDVTINPGDYVYADADGVVLSDKPLFDKLGPED